MAALVAELSAHSDAVMAVAISHDATRMVTGSKDNTAQVWDLARATACQWRAVLMPLVLTGHTNVVSCVALPPNANPGHIALTGSWDTTVHVRDIETGALMHVLRGHHDSITDVALSDPASHRAASGSMDWTVRLWDTVTGEALSVLRGGHRHRVSAIAIAPDASFLVSSSYDGSICLWTPPNEASHTVFECAAPIRCLALTDRALLATSDGQAGGNDNMWLWRNFPLADRATPPPPPPPLLTPSHCTAVRYLASAPHWCIVACYDAEVHVFSMRTGALLGETRFIHPPRSLALLPGDAKTLVSGHFNGMLRVWRLWGAVEEAALATLGSPVWGRLWRADGDSALWARILRFAGPF
jgi:WD40 repeat protein